MCPRFFDNGVYCYLPFGTPASDLTSGKGACINLPAGACKQHKFSKNIFLHQTCSWGGFTWRPSKKRSFTTNGGACGNNPATLSGTFMIGRCTALMLQHMFHGDSDASCVSCATSPTLPRPGYLCTLLSRTPPTISPPPPLIIARFHVCNGPYALPPSLPPSLRSKCLPVFHTPSNPNVDRSEREVHQWFGGDTYGLSATYQGVGNEKFEMMAAVYQDRDRYIR